MVKLFCVFCKLFLCEHAKTILGHSKQTTLVGIATGYCLDGYWQGGRGLIPGRCKFFLLFIRLRVALGIIQRSIQRVTGALSPRVKRQGREAYHSPPSSVEVKNGGVIFHSPIILHGVMLKRREFTFLLCCCVLRIVGGGVQTGSTRHRGHLLSYCACPG
jgi:hypothetical protein